MPPVHEPPLAVTRYGRDTFLVRSQSRPGVHFLVDLDAEDAKRCTCEDDGFRITPALNRGERPIRERCKHVGRVLSQLEHAANLCEAAGYPRDYAPRLIPYAQGADPH